MQLLNRAQLAAALGRSPGYVSAMIKEGLKFNCGRISLRSALAWMDANPDFRMADAYPRRGNLNEQPRQKSDRKGSRQRKSVSGTRHSVPA